MISEQRLAELIQQYAHFNTDHNMHCALLSISPKEIPEDMAEEEIIEKISTICEDYTPAESSDFCDDSTLQFTNPFTGEELVFYRSQCAPFFSTYKGGKNREHLKRILGHDPYE